MMPLLIFLLVLYLLFWGAPRLLMWWLRRSRRNYSRRVGEAFERAAREQEQAARESRQHRARHPEVTSEEAEYVDLDGPRDEVEQAAFVAEEQVVDAEFEDI